LRDILGTGRKGILHSCGHLHCSFFHYPGLTFHHSKLIIMTTIEQEAKMLRNAVAELSERISDFESKFAVQAVLIDLTQSSEAKRESRLKLKISKTTEY